MKVKGIVKKIDGAAWSDDRGNDKLGYIFHMEGNVGGRGFSINKKSKSGKIFTKNRHNILNTEIEFTCDEWGKGVRLSKETINKLEETK